MSDQSLPQQILAARSDKGPSQPPHRHGYDRNITAAPVVVFLGAGASAALGKPMMAEFIESVIGRLRGSTQAVMRAIANHRGLHLEDILEDLQSMETLSYVREFHVGSLEWLSFHTTGRIPKSDVAQAQTQLDAARVFASYLTIRRAEYEPVCPQLI
jgi:hypothetical protein